MDGIIAAIPAILSLIEGILPAAKGGVVGQIINVIEPLVPVVVKEFSDLTPIVQNIIAGLREKGPSPEDWDRLDAMETINDARFEAAAKNAGAS